MWKVAIIDDDRQVLRGMKQVIPWEELGAEWVGESMNGERGLELVRKEQPDIVITDIYMPVMNGLQMIEILRNEQFQGIILIHSGYSDFEVARKALRLKVEDYLSKPISRTTIRDTLLRAIESIQSEASVKLEHEKLREKLVLYEPFVRKELLKRAVMGTTDAIPEAELSLAGGGPNNHLVLGLEIIRTARISDVRAPDRFLFRFAVQNIINEILNEAGYSFDYVELHGYYSALILHFDKEKEYPELLKGISEISARIVECVHRYLQISVKIGMGGLKESWAAVSDSMEEAFRFSERTASDPLHMSASVKPMKFYHELVEDIETTQGKNAHKIVRHYINALKEQSGGRQLQYDLMGAQFWAILSYTLNDEVVRLQDIAKESSIEAELGNIVTLDQYEAWLNEKIAQICLNQEWHDNMKHKVAIDLIKQFIHENYAEEITIADLAEKVYISKNYLSQIFKNATGETINNYIVKVKMEKARGLLLERKLKIYEVAYRVGYKNIPYFSTTFKKHFGITPAEL